MSLLQLLAQRGGVPSITEAERIRDGGDMPPMRGYVPWNSGFEGTQKQMLEEMLRVLALRQETPEQQLHKLIPMLRAKQGG